MLTSRREIHASACRALDVEPVAPPELEDARAPTPKRRFAFADVLRFFWRAALTALKFAHRDQEAAAALFALERRSRSRPRLPLRPRRSRFRSSACARKIPASPTTFPGARMRCRRNARRRSTCSSAAASVCRRLRQSDFIPRRARVAVESARSVARGAGGRRRRVLRGC